MNKSTAVIAACLLVPFLVFMALKLHASANRPVPPEPLKPWDMTPEDNQALSALTPERLRLSLTRGHDAITIAHASARLSDRDTIVAVEAWRRAIRAGGNAVNEWDNAVILRAYQIGIDYDREIREWMGTMKRAINAKTNPDATSSDHMMHDLMFNKKYRED